MAEETIDSLYECYDSLSPYEVAVLSFTSPNIIVEPIESGSTVVVTTKESYLWAGAVAHALVRNPDLNLEQIVQAVDQAIFDYYENRLRYRDVSEPRYGRNQYDQQWQAIEYFLRILGVVDVEAVYERTEAAVRSLIWRGYIEDPFRKKLAAITTAVVLLMPVGFSSTGPNNIRVDALTWQYVQHTENNVQSRHLRVKVKEAADVVLNRIVPAAIGAIDKLSGSSEAQGMTNRDVQIKLAQLGYYTGEIDGRVGPKTIMAIRRFQSEQYLEVTGYLDAATLQRLKAA